jgi:hypothetical protein
MHGYILYFAKKKKESSLLKTINARTEEVIHGNGACIKYEQPTED